MELNYQIVINFMMFILALVTPIALVFAIARVALKSVLRAFSGKEEFL